ncbi:accessory Sec system S-layer assembly protein [Pseudoneobacillus sp. C159]
MLSFFKKKDKNVEKQGSDSVVDSRDLLGDEEIAQGQDSNEEMVTTSLSFHPNMQISTEDNYYFTFLHNQLPALPPHQLALSGIEIKQDGDNWFAIAFIRNSMPKAVQLGATSLVLMSPDGERLGSKVFNLNELGPLPPHSSRPWPFHFHQSDLQVETLPKEGWTLAFELLPKNRLDLAESWEKQLPQEDKDRLTEHLGSLPSPQPGEVNLAGISGKVAPNGSLVITLFIRNGSSQDIHIEQLPLFIEDATGEVVAKGIFQLQDFSVKALSSKPWTFIFPKEMLTKEHVDLSKWRAYPPQVEER